MHGDRCILSFFCDLPPYSGCDIAFMCFVIVQKLVEGTFLFHWCPESVSLFFLYFRSLLRHSFETDAHTDSLRDCLGRMEDTSAHVQRLLDQGEKMLKVHQLEKMFSTEVQVMSPHQEILMCSELRRVSGFAGHRLYIVHLLTDTLLVSKETRAGFQLYRKKDLADVTSVC